MACFVTLCDRDSCWETQIQERVISDEVDSVSDEGNFKGREYVRQRCEASDGIAPGVQATQMLQLILQRA